MSARSRLDHDPSAAALLPVGGGGDSEYDGSDSEYEPTPTPALGWVSSGGGGGGGGGELREGAVEGPGRPAGVDRASAWQAANPSEVDIHALRSLHLGYKLPWPLHMVSGRKHEATSCLGCSTW
jgi:hypothetical protein